MADRYYHARLLRTSFARLCTAINDEKQEQALQRRAEAYVR
jgi:hypothetical protein